MIIEGNRERLSEVEIIAQFTDAMCDEGIGPAPYETIRATGKLERYDVAGDKRKSGNGWYILHADRFPNGTFGCNKRYGTDHSFTWKPEHQSAPMSADERREHERDMKARQAARDEKTRAQREAKAELAASIWNDAKPSDGSHGYLTVKGIKASGTRIGDFPVFDKDTGEILRTYRGALLIQICDFDKRTHSLQAIPARTGEDGKFPKLYLTGGAKRGNFFPIGQPKKNPSGQFVFIVCEGFATGASIHEATGQAVVVAFDSANLQPVCEAIRAKFPDAVILIAADNDRWTITPIENPGVHYARKAAHTVSGLIAIPEFDDLDGRPTDFNDLHAREGLADVESIINAALAAEMFTDAPVKDLGEATSATAIELAGNIEAQLSAALRGDGDNPYQVDVGKLGIDVAMINRMICSAFWSGAKSKLFLLNTDQSLPQFTKPEAFKFMRKVFGPPVDDEAIVEMAHEAINHLGLDKDLEKKLRRSVTTIPGTVILDHFQLAVQRETVQWRSDMFADNARIQIMPEDVRIILAHNPFTGYGAHDPKIIADYKQHFPQFDEVLEFVVKSRFALDRKKAFLWIKADSDWGKGFLIGVLNRLGTSVELSVKEIETMFEGKPVGRAPHEFKRAFALVFDEFKSVKAELKQVQSEIKLAPKHQLTATVEVFAKLFFSAEGVESLVTEHGVEDQFANRFSYISGNGSLIKRSLYVEVGNPAYFSSVLAYTAEMLNRLVEEMRTMGQTASQQHAAQWLDDFNAKNGIGNHFGKFSDELPQVADDIRSWINRERLHLSRDGMLTETVSSGVACSYLHSPNKVLDTYLSDHFNQSQVHAFRKKKSELIQHLSEDGKGCHVYRSDGWHGTKKAVKLRPLKGSTLPTSSGDAPF
jgi:phage/plasmid primase-like uncharacterized protein